MSNKYFLTEKQDEITIVKMNRPPTNCLDFEFLEQLGDMSEEVSLSRDTKVIILTSNTKVFSAGLDFELTKDMNLDMWYSYNVALHSAFEKLEGIEKPVIAAINGPCIAGGLLIAICCDFRFIAKNKGSIGITEVNFAVPLLAGSTLRLPMLIGKAKAIELMMGGDILTADQAYEIGLVNRVVDDEKLIEESLEYGRKLARKGPLALAVCKQGINEAVRMQMAYYLGLETDFIKKTVMSEDIKEGFQSFYEKREPRFKGL